jgi:hypothetical protein
MAVSIFTKRINSTMNTPNEVYIFSDQPTTCPQCGTRTEITLDLFETPEQTQSHKCPSPKCGFEFVMENYDNLNDFYSNLF